MPPDPERDSYFTKHLFRSGLDCSVRLYYKACNYPENRQHIPFLEHYRYNKEQLTSLARSAFPQGIQTDLTSKLAARDETIELMARAKVTLFDAIFISDGCLAKAPILDKKEDRLTVYQVQTRAFKPKKHSLSNSRGIIYTKWLNCLIDFAFRVYVIRRCHPKCEITPVLVLPSKYAVARSEALPKLLKNIEKGDLTPDEVAADREELLVYLEVGKEIDSILRGAYFDGWLEGKIFEEAVDSLSELYFNKVKSSVQIGSKCKNCEFRLEQERLNAGEKSGFQECWREAMQQNGSDVAQKPVFDLIGPGTRRWIEKDIFLQHQIPEGEFFDLESIRKADGKISEKQRQSLQILKARGKEIPREIVKPHLFRELERWEYPIHFLDFEAGNYVLPVRKERRPYHLLVFQYSCHSLYEDGSWFHHEWIGENDEYYTNYQLVRKLRDIPDILQGTIVQYSEFERNALKKIRKELNREQEVIPDATELQGWMTEVIRRNDSNQKSAPYFSDLSRMVKNYYYNHHLQDSLSIKDVLPAVMAVSPRLRELYSHPYTSSNFDSMIWWQTGEEGTALSPYRLITESDQQTDGVRRGTEAMVAYTRLRNEDISAVERNSCKDALLKYCELDTLAMLMIYQHWSYLMDQQ